MTSRISIRRDQILTIAATNERVQVLDVDTDTSASVWVVFCDDPDRDALLPRSAFIA